jgi:DNA-binding transcriptional MocR family regulator
VLTAIACAWLDDSTVLELEAEKRRDAQARQAIATQALAGMHWMGHPSSYFLWLPLAEDARADQITMALLQERIAVSTAEPYAIGPHVPHALRLALGSAEPEALRAALERVKWVVEAYS